MESPTGIHARMAAKVNRLLGVNTVRMNSIGDKPPRDPMLASKTDSLLHAISNCVGSTGRPFEELESVSVGSLVFPESEMLLLKQASTDTFGFEPHIQM